MKVLVFSATGWYRHPEIPAINGWLVRFGAKHGMDVHVSESAKDINPKNLAQYPVIILNNGNETVKVLDENRRKAMEDWHKNGGGIVALHAALVRQTEWPWLNDLGGCDFDSDSDFLSARVVVDPAALDHPAVRGFGASFTYTADWTNHTRSVTGLPGVKVLLRVDESTYEPVRDFFKKRNGKAMGKDHPVVWTTERPGVKGRFLYSELGHDVASLDTPFGRSHLLGSIRWAAGMDK